MGSVATMRERTVVTAVTTVGEAEAKVLVGLHPSHAVYSPWRSLRSQLAKSSCTPLFLIVVCSRAGLVANYFGIILMLRAIRADGYLPPIVALAVCDKSNVDDFHPGVLSRLSDDLRVETRQCNRILTLQELRRGDVFARSGVANFLLPTNYNDENDPWSTGKPAIDPLEVTYEDLIDSLLNDGGACKELDGIVARDFTTNTRGWTGTEQLQYCLETLWCGSTTQTKDELELAACLYTSYFYGALNRALRDHGAIFGIKTSLVRRLIFETYDWLVAGFRVIETGPIRTFRLECKSGWIGNKGVGDTIPFEGFTSTHLALHSLNSMPGDVRAGTFGEVDQPAILVFEGHCPVLMPTTKYFPNEVEYILPAGVEMKITRKYSILWQLLPGQAQVIAVYHLEPVYQPPPLQFVSKPSLSNSSPQVAIHNTDLLNCRVAREPIRAPPAPNPALETVCRITVVDWGDEWLDAKWQKLSLDER